MLVRLGDLRAELGDPGAAAEAWRRAAGIYEDLGDAAAAGPRRRLADQV